MSGKTFNSIVLVLAAVSLAVSSWIIFTYPFVWWVDPIFRLGMNDHIFISRWLPGLQSLIFVVFKMGGGVVAVRAVLAIISAATILAISLFVSRMFSRLTGVIAALFLSSNLMFLALSTVPYQEILFVFALFTGLYFYGKSGTKNKVLAVIAINLAVATRYEGWLIVGILVIEELVIGFKETGLRHGVRQALRTGILMGGLIPIWLILGKIQLFPEQTGSLAAGGIDFVLSVFVDHVGLLFWQLRLVVFLLSIMGWLFILAKKENLRIHTRNFSIILVSFVILIIFNPYSAYNLRQALLALFLLIPYAAFGLVKAVEKAYSLFRWEHFYRRRVIVVLALIITLANFQRGLEFVDSNGSVAGENQFEVE